MKTKYWFLIGAIFLSLHIIGDMLGGRTSSPLQKIKDKILVEQLAKPQRNPTSLAATFNGPSTPIDPDIEEAEKGTYDEETDESLAIGDISEEGGEEELQDESGLNEPEEDE